MQRQKSFINDKKTLYLVATPIGNLSDITYRAVETLKSVDYIFCEDTRVSKTLLAHYNINKPLDSYHEYNKEEKGNKILELLENGYNVALISDAGMPIISDPGYNVSQKAMDKGYNVVIIPGVSASLSALVVSGLNPHPFLFYGFLSNKSQTRKKELKEIKEKKETLIFYETPHRIKEFLTDLLEILGDRKIALCREITKKFEEILRGNVSEVLEVVDEIKGEIVIVVEGSTEVNTFDNLTIIEHVNLYIKEGFSTMDAIKKVAKDRNVKKQEIYDTYHGKE
ncbi:MAG: 16S rRNA (cytidine(1402)-2'-O)-methyltransferase [Acholeplasmatales bacterium]|nr:16S rRNA (cytidine(1402)-2'-O)-methyltransferase [Acholeplasmatales bacterium]